MQILHTSYVHNKRASLDGLERYYAEVLPQGGNAPEVGNPYSSTGGKISLEAQSDQITIGRLLAVYDEMTNSIRIETLFVENGQRGKNVGAFLIKYLEDDARSKGVQIIFVDTTVASAPEFYRKQGFTVIGEIANYPVHEDTYILMMKRVSDR